MHPRSICVADEATDLWQRTELQESRAAAARSGPSPGPAGKRFARYVLDHPDVADGARVLDFCLGIRLGGDRRRARQADHVVASDLDPFAKAAIRLNAEARVGGRITPVCDDLLGRDPQVDLVLAADVFYERDLAGAVTAWLSGLQTRGVTVLIGDPGRTYLPRDRLDCLATYAVPVSRSLEDAEIKRSHVWRLRGMRLPETVASDRHRPCGPAEVYTTRECATSKPLVSRPRMRQSLRRPGSGHAATEGFVVSVESSVKPSVARIVAFSRERQAALAHPHPGRGARRQNSDASAGSISPSTT